MKMENFSIDYVVTNLFEVTYLVTYLMLPQPTRPTLCSNMVSIQAKGQISNSHHTYDIAMILECFGKRGDSLLPEAPKLRSVLSY